MSSRLHDTEVKLT